jgi:hypothetical protein
MEHASRLTELSISRGVLLQSSGRRHHNKAKRGTSVMSFLKTRHCLVATLCMLSPLFCVAQKAAVINEVSYLSFEVPGALGTYPMSINASMAVTGYYYVSSTETRGFLRNQDGTITTFSVRDGVWTEPESINAAGDITGYYEDFPAQSTGFQGGLPHGFIRYADGRTVTFNGPTSGEAGSQAQPISINDWGEVVGNYPFPNYAAVVFVRSAGGSFIFNFDLALGAANATVATGFNDGGTIIGYVEPGGSYRYGYTVDLRGIHDDVFDKFDVPVGGVQNEVTTPESINDVGAIAGWYNFFKTCLGCAATFGAGGFVRSPQGVFTLFNPPGTLVTLPQTGLWEESTTASSLSLSAPHRLSINHAGTITGSYLDVEGAQHGFVRNPYGTITSFDPPRGRQTTATGINDSGVITGSCYYDWNNQIAEGFLRVPQP